MISGRLEENVKPRALCDRASEGKLDRPILYKNGLDDHETI